MEKNINYFEEYYQEFLNEFHPDLVKQFGNSLNSEIQSKAKMAFDLYDSSRKEGVDMISSLEIAHNFLKEGKKFSRYSIISRVLNETFEEKFNEWKRNGKDKELCLAIMEDCESVFKKHDTSDDFIYNDSLDVELISKIKELQYF